MGSLQIVVSLIVAPQTSLMVSYVFISLLSKQTPHFDRALSLLSGKGHMPDVVAFHVIQWLPSAGRGGGSAKSVWTLTVMTQFKNNLYSWALIFEFHITFLSQEIFFRFWFFFSPSNENMFRPSEAPARENMQVWPTGCDRSVSKFLLESYTLLCLFWHCCIAGLCLFLLNERGPWAFSQSPESPVYNRCLLNGVQMNGVAIIPLAAWRCLHETFWKWLSLS